MGSDYSESTMSYKKALAAVLAGRRGPDEVIQYFTASSAWVTVPGEFRADALRDYLHGRGIHKCDRVIAALSQLKKKTS
jgi:hypothetical protein